MNNLKDIHNSTYKTTLSDLLFYQDFNEQFEGYTQLQKWQPCLRVCCFIRISMNNLKDIHNYYLPHTSQPYVVLSGFQ